VARPDDRAGLLETAALVALLRITRRPPAHYSDLLEEAGSARIVLEYEEGLLAPELAETAAADVAHWLDCGIGLVTLLDPDYPENLRAVHDRPPLLFLAGELRSRDGRAVAVIGSRRASPSGIDLARAMTEELISGGYTVVSGLAAGIDAAAHTTALERGARTIAVIGTGLNRCYPRQNATLQERIARDGAVISQFWPDTHPSRQTFPLRNVVMSGLALATAIVEAGPTSGVRIQARHALAHGRPVVLVSHLLDQPWARDLATRPGVHVISTPGELVPTIERFASTQVPAA
jgi:DNA processing protein